MSLFGWLGDIGSSIFGDSNQYSKLSGINASADANDPNWTPPAQATTGQVLANTIFGTGSFADNRQRLDAGRNQAIAAHQLAAWNARPTSADAYGAPASVPTAGAMDTPDPTNTSTPSTIPNALVDPSDMSDPVGDLLGKPSPLRVANPLTSIPSAASQGAAPAGGGLVGGQQASASSPFYNTDGSQRTYQQIVSDPRIMAAQENPVMAAQIKPVLDNLREARDQYVIGPDGAHMVSSTDPSKMGPYQPKLPEGAEPIYDARGNQVGIKTTNGYLKYLSNTTGVKEDATNASDLAYKPAIAGKTLEATNPLTMAAPQEGPNGAPVYKTVSGAIADANSDSGDNTGYQSNGPGAMNTGGGGPMTGGGNKSLGLPGQRLGSNFQPAGQAGPRSQGQSTEAKARANAAGGSEDKEYQAARDGRQAANDQIGRLDAVSNLLNGIKTGAFTGNQIAFARAAQAAGFQVPKGMDQLQAANALTADLVNRTGRAPGAQSDAELAQRRAQVANVNNDPKTNALIIANAKAGALRDRLYGDMADAWVNKYGSLRGGPSQGRNFSQSFQYVIKHNKQYAYQF